MPLPQGVDRTPEHRVDELERLVAHLELALDAGHMGTWQWDLASGRVGWSSALEQIYGLEAGTFGGTFEAYIERIHPDDRADAVDRIRQAAADRARFAYGYRIVWPDGSVRWIEGAGRPLLGSDGALTGLIGVCSDATARHEADERLRRERDLVGILYRVGQAVFSRLELAEVVQVVTESATTLTGAAFGAFFYNVLDEAGESYQLVSMAGVERGQFDGFPMPRATAIFAPTFRGEGIVRLRDVTADPRFGHNPPFEGLPPGHLPVRSYLAAPVVLHDGEVAGGLFFGHPEPGRFDDLDERLVAGIATQAAIALENSRRYEREHGAAHALQASLLPAELPAVAGMEVAAIYQPGVDGVDVGGDWYDVVPVDDDRTLLVVGDVVGRGIPAAAVMGSLRHTTRAHALDGDSPATILGKLTRVLDGAGEVHFATVLCARWDRSRGQLVVASAGHPPAVVVEPGRLPRLLLTPTGLPVGVSEGSLYQEVVVDLPAGAEVVLYTDGLVERRGESIDDGLDRLVAAVAAGAGRSIHQLLDDLLTGLAQSVRTDDIALLGVHLSPPPSLPTTG